MGSTPARVNPARPTRSSPIQGEALAAWRCLPPHPTLPHKGGGLDSASLPPCGSEGVDVNRATIWGGPDSASLPPCGGGLGWGYPRRRQVACHRFLGLEAAAPAGLYPSSCLAAK